MGKNAVQAIRKLCDMHGDRTPIGLQNFIPAISILSAPLLGRPLEVDVDKIKSLVAANRRITTRETAANLNLSKATVHKHMKRLELISKFDIWVPHDLTERNLLRRINYNDKLIRRQTNDAFLKRIATKSGLFTTM